VNKNAPKTKPKPGGFENSSLADGLRALTKREPTLAESIKMMTDSAKELKENLPNFQVAFDVKGLELNCQLKGLTNAGFTRAEAIQLLCARESRK
jgi:hypothetical protein